MIACPEVKPAKDARRRPRPRRRGLEGQRDRRSAERAATWVLVSCLADLIAHGVSAGEAARLLGAQPRTVREWRARLRAELKARGRPPEHASREERAELLARISEHDGRIGVPALAALFPELARREVAELKARWNFAHHCRGMVFELTWTRPGTVWAMDHSEPPAEIAGGYTRLLAVRDLGSGKVLSALPAEDGSAALVAEELRRLIARHGAPLVIKSDNGSALRAADVQEVLREHGILALYSPPRTPRYNGACEAGIGALKVRADAHASSRGRPGRWTPEDVEHARRQSNEEVRPRGPNAASPEDLWQRRLPITEAERQAFQECVRQQEHAVRHELGIAQDAPLGHFEGAKVGRGAIPRALTRLGLLLIRKRRRVSPPIQRRIAA